MKITLDQLKDVLSKKPFEVKDMGITTIVIEKEESLYYRPVIQDFKKRLRSIGFVVDKIGGKELVFLPSDTNLLLIYTLRVDDRISREKYDLNLILQGHSLYLLGVNGEELITLNDLKGDDNPFPATAHALNQVNEVQLLEAIRGLANAQVYTKMANGKLSRRTDGMAFDWYYTIVYMLLESSRSNYIFQCFNINRYDYLSDAVMDEIMDRAQKWGKMSSQVNIYAMDPDCTIPSNLKKWAEERGRSDVMEFIFEQIEIVKNTARKSEYYVGKHGELPADHSSEDENPVEKQFEPPGARVVTARDLPRQDFKCGPDGRRPRPYHSLSDSHYHHVFKEPPIVSVSGPRESYLFRGLRQLMYGTPKPQPTYRLIPETTLPTTSTTLLTMCRRWLLRGRK
ncbi:hypothetical protein Tsubulata_036676 [Turnera subulata]|uniref:Uncharacterized protein n=1 Tax=Turnera subulata TaxID=218843 RepID=A0A9Q0JLX2_9ROSI|nr:hypothetical protein Tsubulata_036676 [Turnera subulata]